jgi:hypothetical protein
MEKEFVPYEFALRMKQLGFDEPCFGVYPLNGGDFILCGSTERIRPKIESILAPTYSQVFKWFRDKYKLKSYVDTDNCYRIFGGIWDVNEYKDCVYDIDSGEYDSHEESELECLKNIIEIVESENK